VPAAIEAQLLKKKKMIKKPNLVLSVVLVIIIEGLAIYLNMVAHPESQPGLTIFIVLLMALVFGLYTGYLSKKNKMGTNRADIIMNKGNPKYGIFFLDWGRCLQFDKCGYES